VQLFSRVYGLSAGPNFADPHHGTGQPDKNILFLPTPLAEIAKPLNLTEGQLDARLEPMRQALYAARAKRKQPLLDTKILTSWNALMIRAFAVAGRAMNEPRYTQAAARAAQFLLSRHRTGDGGLFRTSRDGVTKYNGFLDDYAFLCLALLELAEAGAEGNWRGEAEDLLVTMAFKFGDDRGSTAGAGTGATPTGVAPVGFYFTERDADDLVVRQKTAVDSPLPSGNAAAAMAMLELDRLDAARNTLALFAQHLEHSAEGMSSMVQALALYLRKAGPFRISPQPGAGTAERPTSPQELAAGVVTGHAGWTPDRRQLHLKLTIADGYHLNSHNPGGDSKLTLYGTVLQLADEVGGNTEYPPGEELKLGFSDQPIRVYSGEVTLVTHLTNPPAHGSKVRVSLSYQACTDQACLPPVVKQMDVPA
jgi:uncharacterized protein YyaL (SSP411 family)